VSFGNGMVGPTMRQLLGASHPQEYEDEEEEFGRFSGSWEDPMRQKQLWQWSTAPPRRHC
jgi:hypothetical protein